MSTVVMRQQSDLASAANAALKASAQFWFLVAVAGQLAFAAYIAIFYGGTAIRGDFESWNRVMPHGHVPGDTMGNLAVAMHVLLAFTVTVAGALQLVPRLRRGAPAVHRWMGRVYIGAAFVISTGGLYMVWVRGSVGDLSQHVGISLNAVFIMLCAAFALRHARARELAAHRRWALRLFLVMSGVWFFRVGLMLSIFLNGGPLGFDPETFTGPFLTFLIFAQFLVPLAVLELYLRAQSRGGTANRLATAAALFVLTIAMGLGIVIVIFGMWLPRL